MKMSDWFKSEIRLHGDIIECNDFAYAEMSCEYIVDDIDAGVAICHAVNNHDRMTGEISDLIAVLSNTINGWDCEEVAHHCGVDAETASRVINLLNK